MVKTQLLFFTVGVIFMMTACIEASNVLSEYNPMLSIGMFWLVGLALAVVSVADGGKRFNDE